jgi:iron(II)-dependent oxidoreductase
VVWDGNSGGETASVGSRPDGVSWVGAEDMSGNVWEWVSSVYRAYPYGANSEELSGDGGYYVLRGGSWFTGYSTSFRASFRYWAFPFNLDIFLGFRCARS